MTLPPHAQPLLTIIEWMRFCLLCRRDTRHRADHDTPAGLLATCTRCGHELIAPWTHTNTDIPARAPWTHTNTDIPARAPWTHTNTDIPARALDAHEHRCPRAPWTHTNTDVPAPPPAPTKAVS
jgi:hypothetical protein